MARWLARLCRWLGQRKICLAPEDLPPSLRGARGFSSGDSIEIAGMVFRVQERLAEGKEEAGRYRLLRSIPEVELWQLRVMAKSWQLLDPDGKCYKLSPFDALVYSMPVEDR